MSGRDFIAVSVCMLVFVALVLPLRSCLVDDTYIHLQYARNLAEAGELSFNRGEPTYGATSPLWVLLLAIVYKAGGEVLAWCRVLSWIFGMGTIAVVYHTVLVLDGRRSIAAAAALLMACEAWLLRWSAVGMETSFAVFMVTSVLAFSIRAFQSPARSALQGILLLLAVLARPEAALLAPLLLVASVIARRPRAPVRFLWLFVFVPAFALWLFVIGNHTGSFFPMTASAKQGRLLLSGDMLLRALVPFKIMGVTTALPWLSIAAGIVTGALLGKSASGRRTIVLFLSWIIALPLVYVLLDFQVLSRYMLPVIPAVVILGAVSLGRLMDRFGLRAVRRSTVLIVFTAAAILQSVVFYHVVVVPPTRAFSSGLREVVVGMASWLEKNTNERSIVAAPDIGAIGFVSRRTVLDLGGLVTPEINHLRRRIDFERIVEEGLYLDLRPDFLVDRNEIPMRFAGKVIRGVRFTPVMHGTVSNLGIRKPGPVVYVLYRLDAARAGKSGDGL